MRPFRGQPRRWTPRRGPSGRACPDPERRAGRRGLTGITDGRGPSSLEFTHGLALPIDEHEVAQVDEGSHPLARDERSEEHTSELQSPCNLVCRLLLEKKKIIKTYHN